MLVGRESQWLSLRRIVTDARAGRAGLAVIDGPPGTGKTALVKALADDERRRGGTVLWGRGSELETGFSLSVVRQLLEPVLDEFPRCDDDPGHELLHELYLRTCPLTDRGPVLVVVDDLHLTDETSVQWLAHLTLRMDTLPIAVVVTTRTGERGHGNAYATVVADQRARRITLDALAPRDLLRYLTAMFGTAPDDAFLAACRMVSGGNPLMAHHLAQALVDVDVRPVAASLDAVPGVAEQVLVRIALSRLGQREQPVRRVAETLAVLGRPVEQVLLAELCGMPRGEVADAVGALVRDGLVRPGDPVDFVNAAVLGAIADTVCVVARERVHAEAARLLADRGATSREVATQLMAAPVGADPRAVEVLERAARDAADTGDFTTAAEFLRGARREPLTDPHRRAGLTCELGITELIAGLPGATAHLREAWRSCSDPVRRGFVAGWLANALDAEGRSAELTEVLVHAVSELDTAAAVSDRDRAKVAESRAILRAQLVRHSCSWPEPVHVVHDWVRDAAGGTSGAADSAGERCLAVTTALFSAATTTIDADRAATLAGAVDGSAGRTAQPTLSAAHTLVLADRPAEATSLLDELVPSVRRETSGTENWLRAAAHQCCGALESAELWARAAVDTLAEHGHQAFAPAGAALLADVLLERGQLDEAEAVLDSCTSANARRAWSWSAVLHTRGRLLAAKGQHKAALALFLAAGKHAADWPFRNPAMSAWRSSAALALARLGVPEAARALADEELELARAWGAPRPLGRALRAMAAATETVASIGQRRGLLEEAVRVLTASPAKLDLAQALVELGVLCREQGDTEVARGHLRRALDLAHSCAAVLVAERAYAELVAAGARPRRPRQTGPAALTRAEHRVAELAISGRSNRDIAAALFVTQRAVESTLTSVYRKLGIAGRFQLARALNSAPTVPPRHSPNRTAELVAHPAGAGDHRPHVGGGGR